MDSESPAAVRAMEHAMENPTGHFVELVVRHQHDILRFLRALGLRSGDLDEVLQQTMTRIWEKWDDYDSARAFLPWALKFAHLETLKYRERRSVDRLIFNSETLGALAEQGQADSSLYEIKLEALRKCLQRLQARDYELLFQKYGLGCPAVQLAERMRATTKAVYRRLDRIREMVINCVRRRMADAEA